MVARHKPTSLSASSRQPLIAMPVGEHEVRYFTSDAEADEALGQEDVHQALAVVGAWSHLGDDFLQTLQRIRYESEPTLPLGKQIVNQQNEIGHDGRRNAFTPMKGGDTAVPPLLRRGIARYRLASQVGYP